MALKQMLVQCSIREYPRQNQHQHHQHQHAVMAKKFLSQGQSSWTTVGTRASPNEKSEVFTVMTSYYSTIEQQYC